MSAPRNDADRPMAEPATQQSGNEVGGMRAGVDRGFGDATQRSMEHVDGSALGRASTGDASGGAADPRLDPGGKNAPGSAETPMSQGERPASDDGATPRPGDARASGRRKVASGANAEDDDGPWRHEPVAPIDEQNPLKSLGRAVADAITRGAEGEAEKPKR